MHSRKNKTVKVQKNHLQRPVQFQCTDKHHQGEQTPHKEVGRQRF